MFVAQGLIKPYETHFCHTLRSSSHFISSIRSHFFLLFPGRYQLGMEAVFLRHSLYASMRPMRSMSNINQHVLDGSAKAHSIATCLQMSPTSNLFSLSAQASFGVFFSAFPCSAGTKWRTALVARSRRLCWPPLPSFLPSFLPSVLPSFFWFFSVHFFLSLKILWVLRLLIPTPGLLRHLPFRCDFRSVLLKYVEFQAPLAWWMWIWDNLGIAESKCWHTRKQRVWAWVSFSAVAKSLPSQGQHHGFTAKSLLIFDAQSALQRWSGLLRQHPLQVSVENAAVF